MIPVGRRTASPSSFDYTPMGSELSVTDQERGAEILPDSTIKISPRFGDAVEQGKFLCWGLLGKEL